MGLRGWWLKVRALVARNAVERELDEEIRFHLAMEAQDGERRGLPPRDARREAHRRFGGVERFKEQAREARGTRWLEDLGRDTRHALRLLRRSPVFSLAALLTFALGIGATAAVSSVVRAVLLRPLPFPEPDGLVTVWLSNPRQGIAKDITSWPNFRDWREQGRSFSHMVAVRPATVSLGGDTDPQEVRGARVTEGFFEMLGAPLGLGRGFTAEEHSGGSGGVAVLSHELWTRRFAADAGILGRTVTLDDEVYEVVGVTARGRRYPEDAELWTPLAFGGPLAGLEEARGPLWLPVVGRLAGGVGIREAQAEMAAVAARLEEAYPDANEGKGITLEPLRETLVGDARPSLLLLMGAVTLVLLVACANVANLLLARAAGRGREMAVRLSVGAGRGRLVRQVMAESAVLGVLGGVLGIALAFAGVAALLALAPSDLPRLEAVAVDRTVAGFALLLAAATGVVFGLLPAAQVAGAEPGSHLKQGGRGASTELLGGLRSAFVASQFALALVLLAGAGLLLRSLANLRQVDPGFVAEGVLSLRVNLPPQRYPDAEAVREFQRDVLSRLGALPGAVSADVVSTLFLGRLPRSTNVSIEGRTLEGAEAALPVAFDAASPGLLATLGMELSSGRGFSDEDRQAGASVAVVNEAFVRRYLPGEEAVGRRFLLGGPSGDDPPWMTIVGVVRDARRWGLDQPVAPYAFLPTWQYVTPRMALVVRAEGDPLALAGPARQVVRAVDPALPVTALRTLEQAVSESLARRRFLLFLLGVFAGAATTLAAVGIYGVLAYLVGQRTREIGIRVALGADRGRVIRSVLGAAAVRAGWGLGLGLAGALLLSRFLESQLFGLRGHDPATFAGVGLLLALVALGASWLPARRAASVDPGVALRAE